MYAFDLKAWRHINEAINHIENERYREARVDLECALHLSPDEPMAHWNNAIACLAMGDYKRGLEEYEWRLRMFPKLVCPMPQDVPQWEGQTNCTLLLVYEQGYGDQIMALRFIPELIKRNIRVKLLLKWPMRRLGSMFAHTYTDFMPKADYVCPLLGVMKYLPLTNAPYLPYKVRKVSWNKKWIGVVWQGNPENTRDKLRSIPFKQFVTMFDPTRYTLINLGLPDPEAKWSGSLQQPDWSNLHNVMEHCWAMDHVVCVDTAALHVAAAMGHPSVHALVANPMDWRWYHKDRWYPTVNLYKQPVSGDWSTPLNEIKNRLFS